MVLTDWIWKEGATQIGSGEKINLTLPVGEHAVVLTVIDSGGNDDGEATTITVLPFGYPDVESLSPASGSSSGGYEVTISGSGFTSSSELIVHFGLSDLTGNDITVVDANTIKVIAPLETVPVPVQVGVESIPLNATSNSATFTYETSIPIKWTSQLLTTLPAVTVAAFGPDGKLYAGNLDGQIAKITLDDNFNVIGSVISTVAPFRAILGLTFDPMTDDTEPNPQVYFTSSFLFHGESNSSSGNAINGKIHRVSGANLDVVEDIVTGLPVCDLDHGKQYPEFGWSTVSHKKPSISVS